MKRKLYARELRQEVLAKIQAGRKVAAVAAWYEIVTPAISDAALAGLLGCKQSNKRILPAPLRIDRLPLPQPPMPGDLTAPRRLSSGWCSRRPVQTLGELLSSIKAPLGLI